MLFVIQKTYKKLNSFLVEKKLVATEYQKKDFTVAQWNGSNPTAGQSWDTKLATKPSWLDEVLTLSLFILPFLFAALFGELSKNAS